MNLIDARRLAIPLELLDYALERIFIGLDRGHGDLQETAPSYEKMVMIAMDELHRLHDETKDEDGAP